MNFLIPLGAAAGGALQGLALTRELQEQERLRKQQEFEKALSALTHVMTSQNATPEALEYIVKLLSPVFEKQGVQPPPMPQIKPKAVQDFEIMLKNYEILLDKYKKGEITQEQYYTALYGKPDKPKEEVEISIPFRDKTYTFRIPATEAAKLATDIYKQEQLLAAAGAGGGGGRGHRYKAPPSFGAEMLRDIQAKLQAGDLASAQAMLNTYNAMASMIGAVQFDIVKQKVGDKERYDLWAKGAAPSPTKKETKKIRPDEQAKRQGLNLEMVGRPPLK